MKLKKLFGFIALTLTAPLFAQNTTTKSIELGEVTVTASRMNLPLKALPQKIEIIDRAQIEAIPNENLGELLKRTTNIDVIQYPGALATIGMRGFPATAHSRSYTLILIDGKPAGTNNLATLPTDLIERVEVVKGPYSVLYGSDAMGGVVNIITKQPSDRPSGSAGVSVGNFGQTQFTGSVSGALTSRLSLLLGFSRTDQSKDYRIGSHNVLSITETQKNILDKKSYGDVMANSQYQIQQVNGKLRYRISDRWDASLLSNLTVSNDIETPGNYWHSYGMGKKDIDRTANYLDVRRSSENNELILSPYFTVQREANYDTNADSAFINSRETIRQYGIKIGNTHTWNELRWMVGADYDYHHVGSQKYSQKHTPTNPLRPDHSRQSASAFTQIAYRWNGLTVNAGLRYNFIGYTLQASSMLGNSAKTAYYSNVNPSLGLKYRITPQLELRASAGNAFYVPDAYKTAGVYKIGKKQYVGNSDLKPETSTAYDFGVNYSLGSLLSLDATYFQGFYKNKIVDDKSRKDTVSYKNASDGMMNGVELLFSSDLAKLWNASYQLELYAGMTYFFNNRFDDQTKTAAGKDTTVTKETLYTRKATANMGIRFNNRKGFEARLNARYIGHRLENDWMSWDNLRPDIKSENYYAKGGYRPADQILQHAAHLVFDLSAHYQVTPKAKVGVSISNLLDENYSEKDGYNMPGRSVMGHVSFRF